MTNGTQTPSEVWVTFSGDINAANVPKIFQYLVPITQAAVKRVHLLFHTWGGYVGDGVTIYNFFRAYPIELTLYNVGACASAGVVAYLGAKERIVSTYATFMIHRTQMPVPTPANADKMHQFAGVLLLDDARTEAILKNHITLTPAQWGVHKSADLHLTANEAVTAGIATAIGDFSPPTGTKIINIQ